MDTYGDDPCEEFLPRELGEENMDAKTRQLTAQMHKAICVLQFKTESALIAKHPEWEMEDRRLLTAIDYKQGTITLGGKTYEMTSCHFPTIAPSHPEELTEAERLLMSKLHHSFRVSEKLHRHIRQLLQHGCMYAVYNNNLLFHASVPLNADGSLREVRLYGEKQYSGKDLLHHIGMLIRSAFQGDTQPQERAYAVDYFLYLWCGKNSPLFDKSKMATFERYFLREKETHKEEKGFYYRLRDDEHVCDRILDSFGVNGPNRHIINGHVPVHVKTGENPIKANGKLMVIDGGFSQAYHKETGIAGYTLVYHSRCFQLVQHEPFTSSRDAVIRGTDIKSTTQIIEMSQHRMLVADTDKGVEIRQQISDLQDLLYAYRHGFIKERDRKNNHLAK
jgi:fructose-1,6-bisphosphatase-3